MNSPAPHNNPTKIQLLGIGSANDRALKHNLSQAMQQLALDVPIEEVRDIESLLEYGISGIPALIVNGKVVFQKVVPSIEDIRIVLNVLLRQKSRSEKKVERIVVPTDFSKAAQNAYHYACELAGVLQAQVHLVHVHQPPVDMGGIALTSPQARDVVKEKEQLLEDWKKSARKLSRRAKKVPVSAELKVGFVVDELRRISGLKSDLMIMGMTGNSGILDKWLGTTATELSRRAACPVLLVPQDTVFTEPKNIVYASAYAPGEEQLLPHILSFVNQFEATLHFVHIEEVRSQPQYTVKKVPVSLPGEEQDLKFNFSRVNSRDVLSGLHKYSEDHESDMMVMATPRRNMFEELFHRSTTRRMIFQASNPLLILHYEKE